MQKDFDNWNKIKKNLDISKDRPLLSHLGGKLTEKEFNEVKEKLKKLIS